jgi:hypothetical protein
MTGASDILDSLDESGSLPLGPVLRVMNQLQQEGLFAQYVMGGSMALMYYCEPFATDDVDFFCHFPQQGMLFDLGPIYQRLTEMGCKTSGLYMIIEGVPVQFLSPDGPLLTEAMNNAVAMTFDGVPGSIFQFEYALAIKADANRNKDWGHIATAIASADVDQSKLHAILEKFGLLDRWRKHIQDE